MEAAFSLIVMTGLFSQQPLFLYPQSPRSVSAKAKKTPVSEGITGGS
jgi:hypothetical protein